HPFKEYSDYFGSTLTYAAELAGKKGLTGRIVIGGNIMDVRQIFTKKKNEPMAFVKLEDVSGGVEAVVFPSVYKDNVAAIVKDTPVIIDGKLDEKDGEPKILADRIYVLTSENLESIRTMLSQATRNAVFAGPGALSAESSHICISMPPTIVRSMAAELKRIFGEHPGNRRVFFKVKENAGYRRIETPYRIAFSGDAVTEIEKIVGKGAVLQE
ncbi:MAG TPA: OB-fold nucleic acid binding domain-containing protein, partial [Candidatus Eisenbacteria bacterium]|nr:OB-fold nucleic acid binding domain-containing protein [Candidatus Eisenbacteria bacterium]